MAWSPNPTYDILAAAAGAYIFLIAPRLRSRAASEATAKMLEVQAVDDSKKSVFEWEASDEKDRDIDISFRIKHKKVCCSLTFYVFHWLCVNSLPD